MRVLDAISEFLDQKSSVQKVADDPQIAAELLLLIRTMFADGEMNPQEIGAFKSLCKSVFGIPPEDVPEVIRHLRDVSYETTHEQAASMFVDMPDERKKSLVGHLMMMAMSDASFHERERDVIARVARVLGYPKDKLDALL